MLLDLLGASRTLHLRNDDDYIDRMHYFITSNLLIVLSILVSFKMFNGKPMECVMAKRFDDSIEDVSVWFFLIAIEAKIRESTVGWVRGGGGALTGGLRLSAGASCTRIALP